MTRRKRKNWLKYIITLVLLAVFVGGGFLIWQNWSLEGENNQDKNAKVIDEAEKNHKIESEKDKVESSEHKVEDSEDKVEILKEEVKQFDGENPNEKDEITGVVTYAGMNGDNLMIRVNIDQYLADGNCVLKLLKNNETVYEEIVGVIDAVATATCKGFNVAKSDFMNGKISIKILVTSGEKTGTIEGEVNL